MKQILSRLAFFPLVFILAGCGVFPFAGSPGGAGEEPEFFIAAEWNVQALFDGEESGGEYREYREASGWTAEKYAARITAISGAVLQMVRADKAAPGLPMESVHAEAPDLIGFVELENEGILKNLAGTALSKQGYFWTAFAGIPGASLGIGFLSRFPLLETKTHSITVGRETAPRPVLEVRLAPRGKPLVFLLCHWKSKRGNDKTSEVQRRAAARVVNRRLRELKESEPETPLIVMGDLNENHNEFFRRQGAISGALLPDDPGAAAWAARNGITEEFLVLSGEKPPRPRFFPRNIPVLYSPWSNGMSGGSYYYKDNWESIDHFLLSEGFFNGSGWEFSGCRAADYAPFAAQDGRPNVYVPRSGRGLSDHLPLLLFLEDLTPPDFTD